jgi:hypothetical protein
LRDLLLVQIELVGQKPQRPADAERAGPAKAFVVVTMTHEPSSAPGSRLGIAGKTRKRTVVWATSPGCAAHIQLLLAKAFALDGDLKNRVGNMPHAGYGKTIERKM